MGTQHHLWLSRLPALSELANANMCSSLAHLAVEVQLHSYLLDLDWLLAVCPALGRVPRVLVVHGDGVCEQASCLRSPEHRDRFILLEPPCPPGKGPCYHSKMILVRSERRLDLHVASANLVFSDFSAKSNAVWSRSFGRRKEPLPPLEGFEDDFLGYMTALHGLGSCAPASFVRHNPSDPAQKRPHSPVDASAWISEFQIDWIRQYDYSSAAGSRLISSVPPRNEKAGHSAADGSLHKWGQGRLKQLLTEVDETPSGAPLILQFSSMAISNNSLPWLRQMVSAFCPHEAKVPPIRLVFPTTAEVRDSLQGWASGHTLPCHDTRPVKAVLAELKAEERRTRPEYNACMCRWSGGGERARVVPHLKTFTRCADGDVGRGGGGGGGSHDSSVPWVVVGSHNLSKAAWGEIGNCGSGTGLLGMRSYELSVLVVSSQLAPETVFPLPHLPAAPYEHGDTCWQSAVRSNSVTDGLGAGIADNSGSVDHHGARPEAYAGLTTAQIMYGEHAAAQRLLKSWSAGRTGVTGSLTANSAAAVSSSAPPMSAPPAPAASASASAAWSGASSAASPAATDDGSGAPSGGAEGTMRLVTFSGVTGSLGIGLIKPKGGPCVVLGCVEPTSAAAGVPLGARVVSLNTIDLSLKPKAEVLEAIKAAHALGPFTLTFDTEDLTKVDASPPSGPSAPMPPAVPLPHAAPPATPTPSAAPAPPTTDPPPSGVCMVAGEPPAKKRRVNEHGSDVDSDEEDEAPPPAAAPLEIVQAPDCPCGAGPADILTSRTAKNPNRQFFRCPLKRPGAFRGGCDFFEWVDQQSTTPGGSGNGGAGAGAGGSGNGSGGSGRSGNCFKCGEPGHWARNCPQGGSRDKRRRPPPPTMGQLSDGDYDEIPRNDYAIVALVEEDDACKELLARCRQSCDALVHELCFQRDGTRHLTLYTLPSLLPWEARKVVFEYQPSLPLSLPISHFMPWQVVALGLDGQAEDQLLCALPALRMASHMQPATHAKFTPRGNFHISLYRKRGVQNETAQREFDKVRAACQGTPLGSVRVTRIALKVVGADYADEEARILA